MKQNRKLDICIYTIITAEICRKVKVYDIIEEIILCRKRLNDYYFVQRQAAELSVVLNIFLTVKRKAGSIMETQFSGLCRHYVTHFMKTSIRFRYLDCW
jgi:hypothetical protein